MPRPPLRGVVAAAVLAKLAAAYTMTPRWGHAAAYLLDPPTLVIQGGKTDPYGAYTYTSAPNSNETLIIPLGAAFATDSPPVQVVNANPVGPDYAWHCMAPLGTDSSGNWHLMSLGGDSGWASAADTSPDSAWLAQLNVSGDTASWSHQPTGWADQPTRRIYHGCAAPVAGGDVYVTGGLEDNGSGNTFNNTFMFNSTSNSFSSLPEIPVGLYHHSSVLLQNGTLLAFGGVYNDAGNPALEPMDRVFALQTNATAPTWDTVSIPGTAPAPRRGASATLNPDGTIFVFGGADVNFSTVYSDGWILDPTKLSWTQVIAPGTGPASRFDHTAIDVGGGQIVVFGGFGPYVPADTNIHVVSVPPTATAAVPTSSFTPVPQTTTAGDGTYGGTYQGGGNNNGGGTNTPMTQTQGGKPPQGSGSGTSPGSPGPTDHTGKADANNGFTSARLAGLIAGLGVAVLLGVLLFLFARHRYKRKHATGRGGNRAYSEKGGAGLLADPEAPVPMLPPPGPPNRGKEAMAALGVGIAAVGAAAVAAGRKVSGTDKPQGYSELSSVPLSPTIPDRDSDEDEDVGGLLGIIRRSTRRIGQGIRLIGVTRSIDDPDDELPNLQPTVNKRQRQAMLQDEDTRRFSVDQRRRDFGTIPEEDDWVLDNTDRSDWRAAQSLLSDDHLRPPMKGGPVPTPTESLRGGPLSSPNPSLYDAFQYTPSALDHYEASHSTPSHSPAVVTTAIAAVAATATAAVMANPFNHSQDSLRDGDLSARPWDMPASTRLLPINVVSPMMLHSNRVSVQSIPLSTTSSNSVSLADVNEATISNAQLVSSATASMVSRNPSLMSRGSGAHAPQATVLFDTPPESPRALRPIQNSLLRKESLLRRISSTLMSRGRGEGASTSSLSRPVSGIAEVRDPAPQPTDWPLAPQSNSSLSSNGTAGWTQLSEDLYPLPFDTQHRPSITEVGSIRSMGDMHVVQREVSLSSDEARIERLETPDLMVFETSPITPVSPVSTDDRAEIGLQHPTVVLRPTNPGPTPSGSTIATIGSISREGTPPPQTLQSLLPPLNLDLHPSPIGGLRLLPRRESTDNPMLLMATISRSSEQSYENSSNSSGVLPSPTLPWGAQASPHNSPRGSPRPLPGSPGRLQPSPRPMSAPRLPPSPRQLGSPRLPGSPRPTPGGPRPALTVTTTATLAPSPLSPSRRESSDESSGAGHSGSGHSGSGSGSGSGNLAQLSSSSDLSLSAPASIATATPRNFAGRYTPLLTPSPQRSSPNRRAVHDMVASINRRGGGLPSQFSSGHHISRSLSGSPSPSPGGISSPTRMYEIARRDPLTVANPDIREHGPEDER